VVLQTFNAFECAKAFATSVTVINKNRFKNRGEVIIEQMMHHPVAKIGGEYFALHRFVHDEANAPAYPVPPFEDVTIQLHQVLFEVHLKAKLVQRVAFMLPGIVIRPEHVGQQ